MKLRFFNPDVDVLLLELPAAVPSAFKPFLLGWDATSDTPPRAAVGIHYPHGGPRAITFTKCAGSLSKPSSLVFFKFWSLCARLLQHRRWHMSALVLRHLLHSSAAV